MGSTFCTLFEAKTGAKVSAEKWIASGKQAETINKIRP
jgi:hypothetical protein